MKLFSRYLFLFLAIFFVSPLAGKDTQRILKYHYKKADKIATSYESDSNSNATFFCEHEEVSTNNLEEEESSFKTFVVVKPCLFNPVAQISSTGCSSFVFPNTEKLFLLFHELKLYC